MIILLLQLTKFRHGRISFFSPNLSTLSDTDVLTEGRCFSMCEPNDLMVRDDKLMKPVVIHDGFKPTR